MPDDYGFTTFEPLVGETFTFAGEDQAVELRLDSAEALGTTGAGVPAGVLTFKGPREPLLPQATYVVSHEDLGDFELFVVPVAQGEAGTVYEAIFA